MLTMRGVSPRLLPPYLQSGEGRTAEANAPAFFQRAQRLVPPRRPPCSVLYGEQQADAVRNEVSAAPFRSRFPAIAPYRSLASPPATRPSLVFNVSMWVGGGQTRQTFARFFRPDQRDGPPRCPPCSVLSGNDKADALAPFRLRFPTIAPYRSPASPAATRPSLVFNV